MSATGVKRSGCRRVWPGSRLHSGWPQRRRIAIEPANSSPSLALGDLSLLRWQARASYAPILSLITAALALAAALSLFFAPKLAPVYRVDIGPETVRAYQDHSFWAPLGLAVP